MVSLAAIISANDRCRVREQLFGSRTLTWTVQGSLSGGFRDWPVHSVARGHPQRTVRHGIQPGIDSIGPSTLLIPTLKLHKYVPVLDLEKRVHHGTAGV